LERHKKTGIAIVFFGIAIILWAILTDSTGDNTVRSAELEREKQFLAQFDPAIIELAKKNLPELRALPLEILRQCENVKSQTDYNIFIRALAADEDDLAETLREINTALKILEAENYDKHPVVGPLIYQTRDTAVKTSNCIDKVISKYG